MHRRDLIIGASAAALTAAPTAVDARNNLEVPGDAGQTVWSLVQSLPFKESGAGLTIYMFTTRICGVCQFLSRRHPGAIPGVNIRYVIVGAQGDNHHAVTRAYRTPGVHAYHRYMAGDYNGATTSTREEIAIYNRVNRTWDEIKAILETLPTPRRTGTPMSFWTESGRVYYFAGDPSTVFEIAGRRA